MTPQTDPPYSSAFPTFLSYVVRFSKAVLKNSTLTTPCQSRILNPFSRGEKPTSASKSPANHGFTGIRAKGFFSSGR